MPTQWSQLVLCKPTDVLDEVRNLEALVHYVQKGTQFEDGLLLKTIDRVKDRVRQKLQGSVRRIYENSIGTACDSLTNIDTSLDRIANPEELKSVAVAMVIKALLVYGQTVERMKVDPDQYERDVRIWDQEIAERWEDAVRLLRMDVNNTGAVDAAERGAIGYTFSRS